MTLFLLITLFLFIGSLIQTSVKVRKINKEVANRRNQLERLKNEEEELKKKLESDELGNWLALAGSIANAAGSVLGGIINRKQGQ